MFFCLSLMLGCLGVYAQVDSAQIDTVQYLDPWYMFNPMPTYLSDIDADQRYVFGYHASLGYQIECYHSTDSVVLLGVAVTMDTVPIEGMPSQGLPALDKFSAGLMSYVGRNSGNPNAWSFSFDEEIGFPNFHRYCKFRYDFTHHAELLDRDWEEKPSKPFSRVAGCYEFYFDSPIVIAAGEADSFYVTRAFLWGPPRMLQYCGVYMTGQGHVSIGESPGFVHHWSDDVGQRELIWGGVFPIIGYRCTAPTELSLVDTADGIASFRWRPHADAEVYQVAYGAAGFNPDSNILYSRTDNSVRIDIISPDYELCVRKGCRFTTANYDTLIWSEWSRYRRESDSSNGNLDDTVAIGKVDMDSRLVSLTPNPASDCINIVSGIEMERVEAYNAEGRRMAEQPASGYEATLAVKAWPAGTYLLRITTPMGTVTKKLLVQ